MGQLQQSTIFVSLCVPIPIQDSVSLWSKPISISLGKEEEWEAWVNGTIFPVYSTDGYLEVPQWPHLLVQL